MKHIPVLQEDSMISLEKESFLIVNHVQWLIIVRLEDFQPLQELALMDIYVLQALYSQQDLITKLVQRTHIALEESKTVALLVSLTVNEVLG